MWLQGVIRHDGDLEMLGDDFVRAFRAREMDPLEDMTSSDNFHAK